MNDAVCGALYPNCNNCEGAVGANQRAFDTIISAVLVLAVCDSVVGLNQAKDGLFQFIGIIGGEARLS